MLRRASRTLPGDHTSSGHMLLLLLRIEHHLLIRPVGKLLGLLMGVKAWILLLHVRLWRWEVAVTCRIGETGLLHDNRRGSLLRPLWDAWLHAVRHELTVGCGAG